MGRSGLVLGVEIAKVGFLAKNSSWPVWLFKFGKNFGVGNLV